jgi:lysozyme
VDDALTDLNRIFPNFFLLPQAVQIVLADMRFNLGPGRFRSFKKMIAAIRKEDWAGMKREMMDSKWFREDVGLRGPRLVTILDGGEEWYADA